MFRIRHSLWNPALDAEVRRRTTGEDGFSGSPSSLPLQHAYSANVTDGAGTLTKNNVEHVSSHESVPRKLHRATGEAISTDVPKALAEGGSKHVFTTKARSLGSKDVAGSRELEAFGEVPKRSSEQATAQYQRANPPKSATILPEHIHAASEHEVKVGASGKEGAPIVAARSPWAKEANPSGVTRKQHGLGDGQVEGTEGEGP